MKKKYHYMLTIYERPEEYNLVYRINNQEENFIFGKEFENVLETVLGLMKGAPRYTFELGVPLVGFTNQQAEILEEIIIKHNKIIQKERISKRKKERLKRWMSLDGPFEYLSFQRP
jgi:hypothetical protein